MLCFTKETTTEALTPFTTTPELTEDTTTPEDSTTDMTTAGGPLITNGDSTTATTNRGTTSNPDATTAQSIGGGGGGSNVATIAIAVVVALIVVIALVAILLVILALLRRRSKTLGKSLFCNIMSKVKLQQFVYIRTYAAKSLHSTSLKSNKACGVHGETQDTPTNYYMIMLLMNQTQIKLTQRSLFMIPSQTLEREEI